MPAARKSLAVKKSPADKHEEKMAKSLLGLWDALQAVAENHKSNNPPKSIKKYGRFVWENRTKDLGQQSTILAMIECAMVKHGFRKRAFDSSDLAHQYFSSKKRLAVSLSGSRLGIVVNAQAY